MSGRVTTAAMDRSTMLTPEEWSALRLSLLVATCSVLLCCAPAVAVGWLLARREFRGKALFDAVVHLPLVLPPVVVGYALLYLFGRSGPLGRWLFDTLGVSLVFTWQAAVLAAAAMAFPLFVRAVRLSVELVDRGLEDAARTLGASPGRVFLTVTLPLALPGVFTGMILAFARALGEFGATISFAGNIEGQTRTLPLAIFRYLQTPGGEGPALRFAALSVLLSLAALLASQWIATRMTHPRVGR
jgi:molybdate transport system permease protein